METAAHDRALAALDRALRTFGHPLQATRWMSKTARVLKTEPVVLAAESDAGLAAVLEELTRIEHGIYA